MILCISKQVGRKNDLRLGVFLPKELTEQPTTTDRTGEQIHGPGITRESLVHECLLKCHLPGFSPVPT